MPLTFFVFVDLKDATLVELEFVFVWSRNLALLKLKVCSNICTELLVAPVGISQHLTSTQGVALGVWMPCRVRGCWINVPGWIVLWIICWTLQTEPQVFVAKIENLLYVCVYCRKLSRDGRVVYGAVRV